MYAQRFILLVIAEVEKRRFHRLQIVLIASKPSFEGERRATRKYANTQEGNWLPQTSCVFLGLLVLFVLCELLVIA